MRRTCRRWFTALPLSAIALIASVGALRAAQDARLDDEQQIGQEVFNELKAKGEIVASSPLYDGQSGTTVSRSEGNEAMERMLVVVFDSEAKAYEGSRALQSLGEDSIVALYDARVVTKDRDGAIAVVKTSDVLPEGTMGGVAVGSLIGLLGGPVGLAVGAASGLFVGAMADLTGARVGADFVTDVANALGPGKAAVVAEIDEESTGPVDARMEALGGFVFRRALSDVADSEYEEEVAAIKADIAQTKAEHAASRAERKGRLEARIDSLNEKLHQRLDHAKARREAIQREAAAKVEHLRAQAADARQDVKARQAGRIAAVKRRYEAWLADRESHAN